MSLQTSVALQANDKLVCCGDSLTQNGFNTGGWSTGLNSAIVANGPGGVSLVNNGIGGATSTSILAQFSTTLGYSPTVLQIWIGVNDIGDLETNFPNTDPQSSLMPTYKSNIEAMIAAANTAGVRDIVLVTPPDLGEHWLSQNGGDAYIEAMREWLLDYCTDNVPGNLVYCDMRSNLIAFGMTHASNPSNVNSGILTSDGTHLDTAGTGCAVGTFEYLYGVE